MMKVLIVDDEQMEREGMQTILERAFPNLIIEQAKNGQMAVELSHTFQPDIVLMDIKMPGMTGLEAVEKISSDFPTTHFVMVTAYDTFDYLRAAIKLGVKDYLLKPSKVSDIVSTIGKVVEQVEEAKKKRFLEQQTSRVIETDVVTQLLFDHVHDVHVDMLVDMLDTPIPHKLFVLVLHVPNNASSVTKTVREYVRTHHLGWIGPLYGNQLPIIVFRKEKTTYRSQAQQVVKKLLQEITVYSSGVFIGIGSECEGLETVKQSYQHALAATMDLSLESKYSYYDQVRVNSSNIGQFTRQEIGEYIRLGQWHQISQYMTKTVDSLERENVSLIQAQQRILEVLWSVSNVLEELGLERNSYFLDGVENYQHLRIAALQVFNGMREGFEQLKEQTETDTIHQLKNYIMAHSHEDISLDALANRVELSPIYISKMFKEKLGINYIDFLTECRVEKAKKLLSDPEKSVKEITFEVGYHDPNYFSKVFKKICQVTPKEYRKNLMWSQ
ncbi:response regulator [Mangrovibacillus cuniculi]|uniref:Response regulator n=1 Tax=Mangrovibacillus cuniculi TaxID=2593652 RepID=A0A7S8HEE4_9BACI|nr:response regulator [Mangrovibacillus cuniculi]QPC45653.1 response regulator [Mangrovibacillus cuniculi]